MLAPIYTQACQFLATEGGRRSLLAIAGVIATPVSTYIHEMGHAIAMRILFTNTNPEIVLQSNGGGDCTWGLPQRSDVFNLWGLIPKEEEIALSKLGEQFGMKASVSLVSAAGPIVQSVASSLAILAFPKQAGPLLFGSTMGIALYAATAFESISNIVGGSCAETPGHDFCNVWELSGPIAFASVAAMSFASFALSSYHTFKR